MTTLVSEVQSFAELAKSALTNSPGAAPPFADLAVVVNEARGRLHRRWETLLEALTGLLTVVRFRNFRKLNWMLLFVFSQHGVWKPLLPALRCADV